MPIEPWHEYERLRRILRDSAALQSLSEDERIEVIDRIIARFQSDTGRVEPHLIVPVGLVRAHHQVIDLIRKKRRERNALTEFGVRRENAREAGVDNPLSLAMGTEFCAALSQAMVNSLSAEEREAIRRRFYSNETIQQIADAQGISIGTAHKRLMNAFAKLFRALRPYKDLAAEAFRLPPENLPK